MMAKAKFLSDEWFSQVNQLTQDAGDLDLPPAIAGLNMNFEVSGLQDQPVSASFSNGTIHQGSNDDATTTVHLDADTLKAVMLDGDTNRAMEAFMTGKIRVDGDMGQLITMQSGKPSPKQRQLFEKILEITDL